MTTAGIADAFVQVSKGVQAITGRLDRRYEPLCRTTSAPRIIAGIGAVPVAVMFVEVMPDVRAAC